MIRFFLGCALAISLVQCGNEHTKAPAPESQAKTTSVAIPTFDGKQAFVYLTTQTDFGPRVPNSPAHEKCLAYLQIELQKYADAVNLQSFNQQGYNGVTLNLTNIIASFNLKATNRILLTAHWDSRPRADQDTDPKKQNLPVQGANDGASGVAILMEIGRLLKLTPSSAGVDIVLTDGEDYGKEGDNARYLLGARYFAKNLPPGFHPAFGILLDMVGDRDLSISKEPNSMHSAPDIVDLVWSTAHELGVYQFSNNVQFGVMDDHLPLNDAGIKTIDLIDFDYPYWHTTEDTPDKCSAESLEAVGKVLVNVIYRQP